MKEKLSIKEEKFIDAYIKTGNISLAAKMAGAKGKDTSSNYMIGRRWLDNVGMTIKDLHERTGMTDEYFRKKLEEGLNAKKYYFGTWQGKLIQSKALEDTPTRLKALEIAHKLRGEFVDKTELSGLGGGDIVLAIQSSAKRKGKGISVDL